MVAWEMRTGSLGGPVSDIAVALEPLPAGRGMVRSGHIPARASTSLVVLDVPVA